MIEQSHFEYCRSNPIPEGLSLTVASNPPKLFSGREAIIVQSTNRRNEQVALKWYASLSGQSEKELKGYGDEVNGDEEEFYKVGLTEEQVPQSHFFVLEDKDKRPQLYAIQKWIPGRTLKQLSLYEIVYNPKLQVSLANLFTKCAEVYARTGKFPDLTGGDKVSLLGYEIPDPLKTVYPFRTPNIMVYNDTAILHDARTHHPKSQIVTEGVKFHRNITILTAMAFTIMNTVNIDEIANELAEVIN